MDYIKELETDAGRETEKIGSLITGLVTARAAEGLALGLSGGLDSSVVAALAARALGPDRVSALILPERDTAEGSVEDARHHAEQLGIRYKVKDLTKPLEELGCYEDAASGVGRFGGGARAAVNLFPGIARKGFLANLSGQGGRRFREFTAFFRMKHRLRLVAVCREAERENLVVASCANRTEWETGFFVRYGDDSGDIAPIKHLYKTQVFQLGEHLGLPESILTKKPSPDLFAGMKDEEIMGVQYPSLDSVLWCISKGYDDGGIAEATGRDRKTIAYIREIVSSSERYRESTANLL
jgi:NAD+ synthase